jgi:hypothetical protein
VAVTPQPRADGSPHPGRAQFPTTETVHIFPMGSKDKTLASTVDVYPTWASMFTDPGFEARFKKVHPDLEFGTTFEHIQKLRTIESTVLYHVEDAVSK